MLIDNFGRGSQWHWKEDNSQGIHIRYRWVHTQEKNKQKKLRKLSVYPPFRVWGLQPQQSIPNKHRKKKKRCVERSYIFMRMRMRIRKRVVTHAHGKPSHHHFYHSYHFYYHQVHRGLRFSIGYVVDHKMNWQSFCFDFFVGCLLDEKMKINLWFIRRYITVSSQFE